MQMRQSRRGDHVGDSDIWTAFRNAYMSVAAMATAPMILELQQHKVWRLNIALLHHSECTPYPSLLLNIDINILKGRTVFDLYGQLHDLFPFDYRRWNWNYH